MRFPIFILDFLTDLGKTYRDYFKKTYAAGLIFSLFTFIGACLLLLKAPASVFESIHRYFFLTRVFNRSLITHQYGMGKDYNIIDLSRPLFMAFCALFAIGFVRKKDSDRLSFPSIIMGIRLNDLWLLLIAVVAIVITDILFYYIDFFWMPLNRISEYLHYIISYIRMFLPMVILAIAVSKSLYESEIKISIRSALFVAVCFFVFNSFMYEANILAEFVFIYPFLMFIKQNDTSFLIEIFISIPILAFYILGFANIMAYPLRNYSLQSFDIENNEDVDVTETE